MNVSGDRRVERTRQQLKSALMELVAEKGYDAITIQEITDRANVGRTTFYLHYESKDDLLLDHHQDFASHLTLRPLRYEDLLAPEPPESFVRFLEELAASRAVYLAITQARSADLIMKGIQQQMVADLLANLAGIKMAETPDFPLELLANYLAGAQLALIDWWLTGRSPHTAQTVARLLHAMQRQALVASNQARDVDADGLF